MGAPVKFRGVRIGELEKVDFVARSYGAKDGRIRLLMTFHPENSPRVTQGDPREVLPAAVGGRACGSASPPPG